MSLFINPINDNNNNNNNNDILYDMLKTALTDNYNNIKP